MSRPTVAALDDAREATFALLFPFDARRWLRLAALALFLGGGGGLPAVRGNLGSPVEPGGPGPDPGGAVPTVAPDVPSPPSLLAVALAVGAVLVALWLAYAAVGAVAEYALVVAVRDRAVRLRAPAREHLGRGLRLLGFRLAVRLAAVALVGVPAVLVIAAGAGLSPAALLLAAPILLLAIPVLVAAWLVLRLTTDFAVPTTLAADASLLGAWGRLLPTLRAEPVEVGLYLVVRVALGVAAGIATGLVAGIAALVVAVPFVLVGLAGYLLLGPSPGPAGLVVLGLLAAVYLLLAATLWLLVRVPVVVYLRSFSLAALGRLDADLDLLGVGAGGRDRSPDGAAGAD